MRHSTQPSARQRLKETDSMRRLTLLLTATGVLALPAGASAAGAAISPKNVTVASSGVAVVEMANPTRQVLRGSASLVVAGRAVASRAVSLPARSVRRIGLRLSPAALAALRRRGSSQRASVVATLGPRGAERRTVRRAVGLRVPGASSAGGSHHGAGAPAGAGGAPQAPAQGGTPAPGAGAPGTAGGTAQAPPSSTRWVARMGSSGAYDDFAFTVSEGRMQLTEASMVPVVCAESGGSYNRTAGSMEVFDAAGPWTIGQDEQTTKQGVAVNPLVGSSPRSITYKVTGTSQTASSVTGTLGMSFHDSRLDFSTYPNRTIFVNCSGSQSFEAIPAP
jgi:hypothetical protein